MTEVKISDATLRRAASEGMDAFIAAVVEATLTSIGGEITAETLPGLSADQVTLLAYDTLRREVMDGGFVQLIHNGYGPFIFINPFHRAVEQWGLTDLGRLIRRAHKLYSKHHRDIERDLTDDEFMALFEQMPDFDDLDDEFVASEEEWTAQVARYLDEHLDGFVSIEQ